MTPADRIHGLDALRAFALLLGIVLHSALPYILPGLCTGCRGGFRWLVNIIAFVVLLASYHLCVRFTWVGVWLNNRRWPRQREAVELSS